MTAAMSMRYATLQSGAKMPLVGLGTWESSPGEVEAAVTAALNCGYRHLDLAAVYANEHEVGPALAKTTIPRSDIFITSKLWNDRRRPADVRAALETTLADVGVEYLDLYLVHWPCVWQKGTMMKPDPQASLKEAWQTLESLVDEGKLKHIGISNYNQQDIEELLTYARIKPAVNQIELHPLLPQKALVEFCQSKGIVVTAYSPLGRGGKSGLLSHQTVASIAEAKTVPASAVILRWIVDRGIVVIPKSVNADRIKANIDLWDFELSAEDTAALNALEDGTRMVSVPWSTFPDANTYFNKFVYGASRALTGIVFTFISYDITARNKKR